MKINPVDGLKSIGFWLLSPVFLAIMSIYVYGFVGIAEFLNQLITGQGISGIGYLLLSLLILAVYTYLSFRFEWVLLYLGTLILSNGILFSDIPVNIILKVIMLAASIASYVVFIKYIRTPKYLRKSILKMPVKMPAKQPKKKLSADCERRYRETLAKLPSNYQQFLHFCATQPKGEAQRMAKDLPTLFFRYVPCREALEYIYQQNPDNAMVMVDLFIKFDEKGRMIPM